MEEPGQVPFDHVHIEPFAYAVSLIGGKWKMHIVYWLWQAGRMRYSDLKRVMAPISHKVLADQLRMLEQDGLVHRIEFDEQPPHVEYELTELGRSFAPAMHELCIWGTEHYPKDRPDYDEVIHNIPE
ncbi:MAG: winged helix-turn-helix transcriptional regulator [Atopobiaceae bacterium]